MSYEENTPHPLQELSHSDYKLTEGEADITGWLVQNEASVTIGTVRDLLFDPANNAVRYIIIDLNDLGVNLESKAIMVPIGIAHLHGQEDAVILPNIHIDQFKAWPYYVSSEVDQAVEDEVRAIIGSPAALRIEETITELDQTQFYNHHHFDRAKFYKRDVNRF